MAAPKGNKFSKGRPKGAKNKKTQEWEEIGEYLVTHGARKYMCVLQEMKSDKEYVDAFNRILEYFKPKLARSELTGNLNITNLNDILDHLESNSKQRSD